MQTTRNAEPHSANNSITTTQSELTLPKLLIAECGSRFPFASTAITRESFGMLQEASTYRESEQAFGTQTKRETQRMALLSTAPRCKSKRQRNAVNTRITKQTQNISRSNFKRAAYRCMRTSEKKALPVVVCAMFHCQLLTALAVDAMPEAMVRLVG